MSTRALRKLQKLKEQEAQSHLGVQEEVGEREEASEDEDLFKRPAKPSAFAFLSADDDAEEQSAEEPDADPSDPPAGTVAAQTVTAKKPKKKRKKSKVTRGDKAATDAPEQKGSKTDEVDDVDLALQSLSQQNGTNVNPESTLTDEISTGEWRQETCEALSIDPYNLHASNEMRKLFGKAAVSSSRDDSGNDLEVEGVGRRERRRAQQGALGPGRRGQPGRGLATLGLQKNLFIQGKEDWPKGASNGLGMEVVAKYENGVTQYRFVHNGAYRDAQRQFAIAVESMDPQRLLHHLAHNPYHISTLLQVSEIARHERDHTTSGVLLERALFSFGRAVHSTFSSTVAQGKARLDFLRPENREFWLAGWRYIRNLGMRGTWRTAFEWTRLLLSLSPGQDPYFLAANVDQMALKCRQPQALLDMTGLPYFSDRWGNLPNISFSRALALHQLHRTDESRAALREAMSWFPWIVPRLFKELSISRVPPKLWGAEPPNEMQNLLTEYYATHARDLWNSPEATALLVDVAGAITQTEPLELRADTHISLDLARHVLLTEDKHLISLLPRAFTTNAGSSSDPLPPSDSIGPDIFSLSVSGEFLGERVFEDDGEEGEEGSEMEVSEGFIQRMVDVLSSLRGSFGAAAAGGRNATVESDDESFDEEEEREWQTDNDGDHEENHETGGEGAEHGDNRPVGDESHHESQTDQRR